MIKTCLCLGCWCMWGMYVLSQPYTSESINLGTELMPQGNMPLIKVRKTYLYQYESDSLTKSELEILSFFNDDGREKERIFYTTMGEQARRIHFDYDSAGLLMEKWYFNRKDSLSSRLVFTYDSMGLCKSKQRYEGPQQSLQSWTLYDYNSAGKRTAIRPYEGDTLRAKRGKAQFMEYNEAGYLIRQDFCDETGIIYQSFWYDYDTYGQEIHFQSLDQEGNLLIQKRTAYRPNGKEEISSGENGQAITRVAHTYRSLYNGMYEEKKVYTVQGKKMKTEIFRYDQDRRLLLEERVIHGNTPQSTRIQYRYDSTGLPAEITEYMNDALQKRRLFLYEFHN